MVKARENNRLAPRRKAIIIKILDFIDLPFYLIKVFIPLIGIPPFEKLEFGMWSAFQSETVSN